MSASKLLYKYFVVGLFTTSLSCTNSNRKATAHATVSFRRNKWQLSYTFWANRSNLLPFYTKFLYTFPQRSSFASTNNNQNKNETFHHISRFLLRNSRDDRRRNSVHYRQFYLPGKSRRNTPHLCRARRKKNCRQSPSPPATEEGVPT